MNSEGCGGNERLLCEQVQNMLVAPVISRKERWWGGEPVIWPHPRHSNDKIKKKIGGGGILRYPPLWGMVGIPVLQLRHKRNNH